MFALENDEKKRKRNTRLHERESTKIPPFYNHSLSGLLIFLENRRGARQIVFRIEYSRAKNLIFKGPEKQNAIKRKKIHRSKY